MAGDWLKSVHFYRKIPKDLTEATLAGGSISVISSIAMAYLFVSSFMQYMTVDTVTQVSVDESDDQKLHINFNVTFPHLPCRWASVDISDVMGTHIMNITKNVHKFRIDKDGSVVSRAELNAREPIYEELRGEEGAGVISRGEDIDDSGEIPDDKQVRELGSKNFDSSIKERDFVMVNFYAPWCPWSQRLNPVWEQANVLLQSKPYHANILMGKVDCTHHDAHALCHQHHVHAFPTVRIYRDRSTNSHENYVGDRTRDALVQFIDANAPHTDTGSKNLERMQRAAREDVEKGVVGPEGCMILGFVAVNRVPGNLFFTAHSKSHSFNVSKMNISHHIESFSFGKMLNKKQQKLLPEEVKNQWNLLYRTDFETQRMNVTMEHYMKVVHTEYELLHRYSNVQTYQYTVSNNVFHDNAVMPSALFAYEISPMQVNVKETRESLAVFLTQTCAIIGGVFTISGLIDAMWYQGERFVSKKMELGKQT